MALVSSAFVDVTNPQFQRIFDEEYTQAPDFLDRFYSMMSSKLQTERVSSVGTIGVIPRFTGSIEYDDVNQGYDVAITPLEFGAGIQIERRLFDDGLHNVIQQKPKALAASLFRLRQTHASRPWNQAFTSDSLFYTHSEGVALCSNSHTTTSSASTSTGFDNLGIGALSAVTVAAARIQMRGFRGDRAEKINIIPDGLHIPTDLYETAYEIVGSQGKVATAVNSANVHFGQYEVLENIWLTDTNNWFMTDQKAMKGGRGLVWIDKEKGEFAFVEDFDTLIGKWRVYSRWGNAWIDWRFVLGAQVS
tara:strand:+ start:2647 stop:3561 length:915 start_codon:yes stop_codon:yes gene_type:complete